jgi:hypothetical protein
VWISARLQREVLSSEVLSSEVGFPEDPLVLAGMTRTWSATPREPVGAGVLLH